MKCMFCGKTNYSGAVFCRFCGKKNAPETVTAKNSQNDASAFTISPSTSYCTLCGKVNQKGAKFCRHCGGKTAAETVCSYCGSVLPQSANICTYCGGAQNRPYETNPQIHYPETKNKTSDYTKTSSKALNRTYTASSLPQPPSMQTVIEKPNYGHAAGSAAKKRLSAGKVVFTLIVIIALVFLVSKIFDYFNSGNGGGTGFTDISDGILSISNVTFNPSDYNTKGEMSEISQNNKKVSVSGVVVDLSGIAIEGQHTLEVKKLPPKTDDANGMKVNAYDITLGGKSEFEPYVRVSFPYTAKENEYSFIQYYNQKNRTWELIPSDINKANGTITFATNHFSTFAEFVQTNGPDFSDKTSAFDYLGGYKNPLSKVYLVEKKLHSKLNEMDPSAVQKLLEYGEFPTSDGITATLSLINDFTNLSTTPGGTARLLKLFSQSTVNKMGPAFLAIGATATITRCVYQWNQGDSAWNIIKDNGVNLAELGLTAAGLLYSSPVLMAGATGIWAAGLTYENWPSPEYSSIVEKAYHQFNTNHMCFVTELGVFLPYGQYYTGDSDNKYFIHTAEDGKFDYEVIFHDLESTYLKKQKNPKRLAEIIVHMTDTYCESFWQMDDVKREMYIEAVNQKEPRHLMIPNTSLYDENWNVTGNQIAAYKEKMKNLMISEMQPYLERVIYNLTYQIRKDLIDRIRTQLEPWLNQTITVEISDLSLKNGETFDKSAMAAYDIRFIYNSMTSITDYENWNFKIHEKSNQVFEMTVFNYIKAGCPREIGFYEKGRTEPVLKAFFEYSEPVIAVILDRQDYSGIYTGTSYGQPFLGGEKFELKYNAVRILEKENGLLVGPCLENGDYESELQVLCKFNAETQRYEGTVLLEDGNQWTELIFSVLLKNNGSVLKAEVAYIQHFSGRQSMGYVYDVTWKLPISGTAVSR